MTDFNFKPKRDRNDYGWHSRGYLPHFDGPQQPQFITFRLFDSLPKAVLEQWMTECADETEIRKRIEGYLDAGYGECWLRIRDVASIVIETLMFHNGSKYHLSAWVIMPNHAHLLLTPLEGVHLPSILHSIKSFSAQKVNKLLGRSGQFWQRESFDRYIRNYEHWTAVIRYIEMNPVKAALCAKPEDWEFSSAYQLSKDLED
jgi:REP element-mobilizing transposase RayT